jgi:hypothetical protein
MFQSAVFQNQERGTAEERLWRAVIAKTLEEWVRGPLRYSRVAEEFLFQDEKDFPSVCSSAGMDPRNLRERLRSIRTRVMQKESRHTQATDTGPSRRGIPHSLSPFSS